MVSWVGGVAMVRVRRANRVRGTVGLTIFLVGGVDDGRVQ